jgi:predicted nucleotidyltransferase
MQISINQEEIDAFCRRWRITELAFFGSVLRHDFKDESDVDVMVRFSSEATPTLFDMVHMQRELSQILGRDVDLVSR